MFQMNHQRAMAHLTNLLRNAQTTCTDTECFTGPRKFIEIGGQTTILSINILVPGVQTTGGNTGMTNMYLMLAIWIGLALLLFLFRPRSLRSNRDPLAKPMRQVRMIDTKQKEND